MFYNLGIHLFRIVLWISQLFNKKIKAGIIGRRNTFTILENAISKDDKVIWFHCASLGEYEQGLPVFQELRSRYNKHKIVLSFFSPSGYENKKDSKISDVTVYLPLDTKKNAKQFIELLKPELTVFVKYDIWPNYLLQLKEHNLKSILISARFRNSQPYFKWYGATLRNALCSFDRIFVQDRHSQQLLASINYNNSTISGDTRFDRVYSQLKNVIHIPWLNSFKGNNKLVVFGSTWPQDEAFIIDMVNSNTYNNLKFLIAPHEVNDAHIKSISTKLKKPFINYSDIKVEQNFDVNVIVLNTIGLLSKVYAYADVAYIGGAVGNTGLHNILEAAVFGIPIITGKHIKGFPEAQELKEKGGLFTISGKDALTKLVDAFYNDEQFSITAGRINKNFIKENRGAVIQIMDSIRI